MNHLEAPAGTVLKDMAKAFISGTLDRSHPAVENVDWNQPLDQLIADVAGITRRAVFAVPVGDPPKKVTPRISRPGETAEKLVERCLAGDWVSVGREYHFDGAPDFSRSPDASLNSPGASNGEWIWQLNRHHEWVIAAKLYHALHDPKYARAVSGWLAHWLLQAPRPAEDLSAALATWRTIEIGIRLGGTWPETLSAFRNAPEFDDILWLAWLESWAQQADFVWTFRKARNWLLMELNGLLYAGVLLPFCRDAAVWRRNALDTLVEETGIQFHPDGFQVELSAGYHGVAVHNYRRAITLLDDAGLPVPDELMHVMDVMIGAWKKMAKPNGKVFGFQDSSEPNLGAVLATLPGALRRPGDAWFIDSTGSAPDHLHDVLPYAGYAVLRTGWDKNSLAVAFDGGPFGDGHQHEDKLSFQLTAFDADLVGEAGLVDYSDTPQRHYSLTTPAHSTILVDGLGQNRREGYRRGQLDVNEKAGLTWDFDADIPWVRAAYTDGYGPGRSLDVVHTRSLALLDDATILILDHLNAPDEAEHVAESLFHLLIDDYVLNGASLVTAGRGANVGIAAVRPDGGELEWDVVVGGETPDLRGWGMIPDDGAKRTWELMPRPCLTIRSAFRQSLTLLTAIRAFPSGTVAAAPRVRLDGEAIIVDGDVRDIGWQMD